MKYSTNNRDIVIRKLRRFQKTHLGQIQNNYGIILPKRLL